MAMRKLRPKTRIHAHLVRELTLLVRRLDKQTDVIARLESENLAQANGLKHLQGRILELETENKQLKELAKGPKFLQTEVGSIQLHE